MGQAAAHRPTVTNLNMTDVARRFLQQRPALGDDCRPFEIALPSDCADAQRTVIDVYVAQLFDTVQVDQVRRPNQAKIHQRHETLAAGKGARLVAELRQQAQRFIKSSRIVIIKLCRLHFRWPAVFVRDELPKYPASLAGSNHVGFHHIT